MKINEGMYVRTLNGFISKIIEFKNEPISNNEIILIKGNYKGNKDEEYGYKRNYYKENTSFIYRGEIIKASYNIIDLIEVEDYVNGNKVIRIETSSYPEDKNVKIIVCCGDDDYYVYYNEDIKTILTKEQYENNCYKVDDK